MSPPVIPDEENAGRPVAMTMPILSIRAKRLLGVALVALLLAVPAAAFRQDSNADLEAERAQLLAYLIGHQLPLHHFSHKPLDDTISQAAFDLYLRQLDSQKRFLLAADAERLRSYSRRIDDEIRERKMELPSLSAEIMDDRVEAVRKMVDELLDGKLDLTRQETLESDPEKLDFCKGEAQLRERWRKTLKYQVANRYLNLLEDKAPLDKDGNPQPVADDSELGRKLLAEAVEKVRKSQDNVFNRILEEEVRDYYDRYFDAVSRAYDPHTGYLAPDMKEDFDISMSGSLEGIGATLREEDGYIKVVRVLAGSPAARQGELEAEDTILAVAQGKGDPVDITDTRIRDAVRLIRGAKGTVVRLTVKKADGKRVIVPITRDVVQIEDTFVKSVVLPAAKGVKSPPVGYVNIPAFYRDFKLPGEGGTGRNSTDDVAAELASLKAQGVGGIILDLRNNGGGALTDAVSIAGLFIEKGPVVQVRNSYGSPEVLDDPDEKIVFDGPMVVLVNKFSASASEILAGALQDYGRAVIVGGEHTHGKGTVQTILDLDRRVPFDRYKPLGALRVTIQKYYRVSGGSTQFRGVVPDIVLPDRFEYLESGEQYLDYPLPWDTVEGTAYTRWTGLPDLPALSAKSSKRTAESPAFDEIRKQAKAAKERSAQTLLPLALEDIRKEREEARAMAGDESGFSMHSPMGDDGDANLSEEEKAKRLLERLTEDPYVSEGVLLLRDLPPRTVPVTVSNGR